MIRNKFNFIGWNERRAAEMESNWWLKLSCDVNGNLDVLETHDSATSPLTHAQI